MKAQITNALMTTGVVLLTLWVLNQTPARPFVQKAVIGA